MQRYIKGLQKKGLPGALVRYEEVAVESLPADPTAAGVRPGAADNLACHIPAELAVHLTGHDLTSLSALWEYLRARVALLIPGGVVLAGWPSFPYGQMGESSVHPKLTAIVGVGMELFEMMIDSLFNFIAQRTLPKFLIGGKLRPMLHATLATMLMYAPP